MFKTYIHMYIHSCYVHIAHLGHYKLDFDFLATYLPLNLNENIYCVASYNIHVYS